MSATTQVKKDHWSSGAYNSAAAFVPQLTSVVISYLEAQPNDNILDVGCGDGLLTAKIAQSTSSGRVLGVDASESFITTAKDKYSAENCTYKLHDATELGSCPEAVSGQWDKVFSNAAMHWILRKPETRADFFKNVHAALKPGGKFVFEMGGKGNVAEIQAAAVGALLRAGVPLERAREASPWFFPSEAWMTAALSDVGFVVEKCERVYRPTKLTAATADGAGGIEGWVRLMCADYVEVAPQTKREQVVQEICDVVDPILTLEEDGSKWIGNVRLRAVAKKL